jgi:hypothetical protein
MQLIKIPVFIIIFFLIISQVSAQYTVKRNVFSNGSANIPGDNQLIKGTLGQSLIGITENSTYQSHVGFWYTIDWIVSDVNTTNDLLPLKYELFQNYPNPFNPVTTIRYALPKESEILLEVYNVLGQRITTLVNQKMPAGYHDVTFGNNGLPSGYYIYRIRTDGFYDVKRMVIVK